MSIATLVVDLELQGVELWLEGARLRYRAPRGLAGQVREALGTRRDEVVELLRARAQRTVPAPSRLTAAPATAPAGELLFGQGAYLRRLFGGCEEGAAEVARIQADALALGWSLGELWSVTGWYDTRGLVAFLRAGSRVLEVRVDRIVLSKPTRRGAVRQTCGRSPGAARVPESGWYRNPATVESGLGGAVACPGAAQVPETLEVSSAVPGPGHRVLPVTEALRVPRAVPGSASSEAENQCLRTVAGSPGFATEGSGP